MIMIKLQGWQIICYVFGLISLSITAMYHNIFSQLTNTVELLMLARYLAIYNRLFFKIDLHFTAVVIAEFNFFAIYPMFIKDGLNVRAVFINDIS